MTDWPRVTLAGRLSVAVLGPLLDWLARKESTMDAEPRTKPCLVIRDREQTPSPSLSGWSASDYGGWWELVEPAPDREGWKVNGPFPTLDPLRRDP
jgi:hypothetical protein